MYSIGKNIGILNRQFNIFLNRELAGTELNATEFMYIGHLYQNNGIAQDDLAKEFLVDKARRYEKLAESIQKKYIGAAGDLLDGQKQRELETTVSFMVDLIKTINLNLAETRSGK